MRSGERVLHFVSLCGTIVPVVVVHIGGQPQNIGAQTRGGAGLLGAGASGSAGRALHGKARCGQLLMG